MQRNQRLFLVYRRIGDVQYGAISTVPESLLQQGGTIPLEWSYPYVVSKQLGDEEIVYGSITHLMYEATRPILRMNRRLKEMTDSLPDEVRSSLVVTKSHNATTYTMPSPGLSASFLHEQEEVMKDALLLSGVHLRTLLETFSGRGNVPVPLYDYEGNAMPPVSLSTLFNTLMHYLYCVVSGEYVHDIFSGKTQLDSPKLVGSKIKTADCFSAMVDFMSSIRVNDLVGVLRGSLKSLSVDSEPRRIVFALQNVHSLNQLISERMLDARFSGFQRFLFRELTADETRRIREASGESEIVLKRRFGKPSFKVGAELGAELIEMHLNINGVSESFEFGQEEFFRRTEPGVW